MYINGLFLLLFWCLGWSTINFSVGLALVVAFGADGDYKVQPFLP